MVMGGAITRPDGQPLGQIEDVKLKLAEVFNDIRFVLVRDEGPIKASGLMATLLSFLSQRREYPHWEGAFEGREFAVTFEFTAKPVVPRIRLALYGRGTPNATPYLAELQKRTGWRIKLN
ncbi:hypothetical protein QFZ27_001643 [Inquilinus ginsengisoli]|uniref:hypothetical protein n=1 Tax=Inquilinus ginsengisoli TaxID=363840 RepID=UPI003D1F8D3C